MNSSTKKHNRPQAMRVLPIRKRTFKGLSFVCSLAVLAVVGCISYQFGSSFIGAIGEGVAFANETADQQVSELEQLQLLNSRFERRLVLYRILEDADESSLSEIFDRSRRLSPSSLQLEVESIVAEKWSMINPRAVLAKISDVPELRFRHLVEVIFGEWIGADRSEAIGFASQWSHHRKQMVFESAVLPRNDLGLGEKLEIGKQLDIQYIASSLLEEQAESAPIDDAEEYWKSFHAKHRNAFSDLRRDQLSNIAESLVAELGVKAFHLVDETAENIDDKNRILPLVAYQIASADPRAAFDLVVDRKRDETGMLWGIVRGWAGTQPKDAIEAVSQIVNNNKRRYMQETVIGTWTGMGDPTDLLERLNEFPQNSRNMVREKALESLGSSLPEEALEKTQAVQDATVRNRLENSIVVSWAERDASAALAWVRSEPAVQYKRTRLMADILSGMARNNFDLAMDTALAEPVDESGVGLEASVIRGVVPLPPDVAQELLTRMRNEQTKLRGMLSVGAGFLQMGDRESIDRAWNLSELLKTEEDRHRYLRSLVFGWIFYGQEQDLYRRIDQFPTKELKRHAAQMLITNESDTFTDNQLERLNSYHVDETEKSDDEQSSELR